MDQQFYPSDYNSYHFFDAVSNFTGMLKYAELNK